MSIDDRIRWDSRHHARAALKPRDSVLALPCAPRPEAVALDLACGQGRHTAALRAAGYRVIAMDVSSVALQQVRGSVAMRDEDLLLLQADVEAWPFADSAFDLVVQVDFLDRSLFPLLPRSLRSGGLLLIDTFLDAGRPNAEGPSRAAFVLQPGELPRVFAGLELLRYEESGGATARAVMLARRP